MTGGTPIQILWRRRRLPIHDALYRSDGTSYAVRIAASAPGGLVLGGQFDITELLALEPEQLTAVDVTAYLDLPDGVGRVGIGEGSYGSEGFFARCDCSDDLVWVVYLENFNPFVSVEICGSLAIFTSSSATRIAVDILASEFAR